MSLELDHMAEARSDTSTTLGSPVRSRLSRAAEMPKAMDMAAVLSPKPGRGWTSRSAPVGGDGVEEARPGPRRR